AEDAEEERTAFVDLLQAEFERLLVLGLLAGDAPAQVDVDEVDAVGFQPLAQRRKHHLDEVVALRLRVAERGRDEDADGLAGSWHERVRHAGRTQGEGKDTGMILPRRRPRRKP